MNKQDEGLLLDPIPNDLVEKGYHYNSNGRLVGPNNEPFDGKED